MPSFLHRGRFAAGAALLVVLTGLVVALTLRPPASPADATQPCKGNAAFAGLGTWVDIYDSGVWANPERAVANMDRRGVATLLLQTSSNEYTTPPVFRPDRTTRFIEAAHDRGICVVAWYLAPMVNVARELKRAKAALKFRTPAGHGFDGFGLDIETSVDSPKVPRRNTNLLALSRAIRRAAGPGYPLGAITPSPFGLNLRPTAWPKFPYVPLAAIYDVFVPMAYYTYHQTTAAGTYRETLDNLEILRAATGDPALPIHLAGGLSSQSSAAETRAFRRAIDTDGGVMGVSLYDYAITGAEDWTALRGVSFG